MAKLLSRIASLIESAFTHRKAYISAQAMPEPSAAGSVSIYTGSIGSNKYIDYTPAEDGYLCAFANSDVSDSELIIIFGDMGTGVPAAQVGWGLRCYAPIKKGITASIGCIGLKSASINFYPLVGGGGGNKEIFS